MYQPKQPHLLIRERLIELSSKCHELQRYVLELRCSAPYSSEVAGLFVELLKLESRLAIVNAIFYEDEMSLTIERAIDRLKNKGASRI